MAQPSIGAFGLSGVRKPCIGYGIAVFNGRFATSMRWSSAVTFLQGGEVLLAEVPRMRPRRTLSKGPTALSKLLHLLIALANRVLLF